MAGPPADDGWQPSDDDTARVDAQLDRWRQGDVARPGVNVHIGNVAVPLVLEDRDALEEDREGGAVRAILSEVDAVAIVSQTCDVVRSSANRPFVKVSPVVTLSGEVLANASAGRVPRYAALPGLGNDVFADLDRCTTITKSTLAGMAHQRGCPDDNSIAEFGEAVGRHHARFAFPNFVERALGPLSSQMAKRARKNTAEGRCVDALVEVRAVATPEWDRQEPITIDLTFIVDEEHLPAAGDPDEDVSDAVAAFIAEPRKPEDVAAELEKRALTDADRSALWVKLAQAWTELVKVDEHPRVAAVNGDVESESSYPLSKVKSSVRLDLDHLSDG
ncbi:MAG: hypothetical protein M3P34_07550 [Actinomycetota bacterium]|nr:hypothetical protein [Actinomycetota bacterium]